MANIPGLHEWELEFIHTYRVGLANTSIYTTYPKNGPQFHMSAITLQLGFDQHAFSYWWWSGVPYDECQEQHMGTYLCIGLIPTLSVPPHPKNHNGFPLHVGGEWHLDATASLNPAAAKFHCQPKSSDTQIPLPLEIQCRWTVSDTRLTWIVAPDNEHPNCCPPHILLTPKNSDSRWQIHSQTPYNRILGTLIFVPTHIQPTIVNKRLTYSALRVQMNMFLRMKMQSLSIWGICVYKACKSYGHCYHRACAQRVHE